MGKYACKDKMNHPAYGDITQDKVVITEEENAVIRIIAGSYKGKTGVFEGKYVKVQYLDVDLAPDSTWIYSETPNDETLFIYLLDGTLAVDEKLSDFENKSCAVLFTSADKTQQKTTVLLFAPGTRVHDLFSWLQNHFESRLVGRSDCNE